MSIDAQQILDRPALEAARVEPTARFPRPASRVRVDGKFFARGDERLRVRGVTYGPFAANSAGEPFPSLRHVRADFALMRDAGINTVRTYHLPPEWLLDCADDEGMSLFIDVPWPKHLCFLENSASQRQARKAVHAAASLGQSHPCILACSIGNEIPADVVRWHGARRIEQFLVDLFDIAKQADPEGLATYANFPSTEYLDLSFLDFVTFNVYLHDPEAFRRYLFRLQHLIGDRPLLLGELGMDTLRHDETAQADFLSGHLTQTTLVGLAGAFVFSWTDDWHTGGHQIQDWAFGITTADRTPKPAYHAVREIFEMAPVELLAATPRVSVVVCSYNGGSTLEQCLRSLQALNYPNYEIIVVNDGSTDHTTEILRQFPSVKAIHQPNRGLSAARNVGLRSATGSIVAYTDSDCFADADWLTHLVHLFQTCDAAAVGGPNLTPEDGWLAGCVAAAPGQPVHVLESDQVAEHIPGCNMAFRREALESIGGFDAVYRKAGDDVDVCWRLQQAGYWITFAPGAFVWHHRRQNPRAYLRQQAGYGEAEALLRVKHPDRFNTFGDSKWRGVLYGDSLQGLSFGEPMIYHGTFGTALFQCIYRPGPAHWAMLPSTLEWHAAAACVGMAALFWPLAWFAVALMFALSIGVAALQATRVRLAPEHGGMTARLVVMVLCYLQPLSRSWKRYWTRWFAYSPPSSPTDLPLDCARSFRFLGRQQSAYWSPDGVERTELLGLVVASLFEHRWGLVIDAGWSGWDLEVHCNPWTILQIHTTQEEHGSGNRLIRIRYALRPTGRLKTLLGFGIGLTGLAGDLLAWPYMVGVVALFTIGAVGWWRGVRRAGIVTGVVAAQTRELSMLPLLPEEKNLPEQSELIASAPTANNVPVG